MAHPTFAWIAEHGGPDVTLPERGYGDLIGLGEGWQAFSQPREGADLTVDKHITLENGHILILSIYPLKSVAGGKIIRWSSTLKLVGNRYVRAHGQAENFPLALQAVESHQHTSKTIGPLTWWQEREDAWVSWLGDMTLRVTQLDSVRGEGDKCWRFEVSGEAQTLEEAALLASMGRVFST